MQRGHERFEELAVGHVIGGLAERDAAEFRSHLLGCRECRRRVAELRDIASDLAAAEREERRVARLKTEVVRDANQGGDDEDEDGTGRQAGAPGRSAGIALLVLLLLTVGLAFWNLHLRERTAGLVQTSHVREDTLAELASGVVVPVDAVDGVSGLVVLDEGQVAFSFAGLPGLRAGQQLVVWIETDPPGQAEQQAFRPAQVTEGLLASHVDVTGAQRLVLTVEDGQPGDTPRGRELAAALLVSPD